MKLTHSYSWAIALRPVLIGVTFPFAMLGVRCKGKRTQSPDMKRIHFGALLIFAAVLFAPAKGHCESAVDKFISSFGSSGKAAPKETLTTLAQAKKINLPSSVDGVNFNVPLTYLFRGYSGKDGGWFAVPEGQIAGTERPAIDFITIYALMPDLAPMNEENLADFEKPGWGKKVMVSLTHSRSWDYFFKNSFNQDYERRPDSPNVPGMLHYYSAWDRYDTYLSHTYATDDLTMITCPDQNFYHYPFPSCKVQTSYRPALRSPTSQHFGSAIFYLEYDFSMQYLSQWRDIDKKAKSLFDQFIRNAARGSFAHQ